MTEHDDDVTLPLRKPPSAPAKRLGRYELLDRLGKGGMGIVYRARDTKLDRPVAVKMLLRDLEGDDETRERFIREARAAGELNHPNIIKIYDFGEDGGHAFIIMELLEGANLNEFLKERPDLALDRKLQIMTGVCEGLAFSHSRSIIHRDLKPANLFITKDRQVKVLDFGLARIASSKLTHTGLVFGTPDYMSPEQVRGKVVDARSDIFSLGAVFYQVLTGRKPFAAKALPEVMRKVLTEKPAPLTHAEAPPSLARVVTRALQKDPLKRYQKVEELLADLRSVDPDEPPDTASPEGDPRQIDRYQILERVGRGGMGVVYRARDPVLDRDVAIKSLPVDFGVNQDARARFQQEARAAARLQHPNIVTVYEFGEKDDSPYLIMEFLGGDDLEGLLLRDPPLSLERRLDIIAQLCDGLAFAHDQGVVHRDIKPGNVRVLEDGSVKLLDFGIATVQQADATSGTFAGSVAYASPEQLSMKRVDGRSDLFSVGVLAYELLTGRQPFTGDAPAAVAYQVLNEEPPPLRSVAPQMPEALEKVITRALQKKPDQRWGSAPELGDAFRAVARKIEKYLSSATTQLEQGHPENALALVKETLAVERTQAGVELQQRILLAIEDREKEHGRLGAVGRRLRAGRENLQNGAFEAALKAADEVLADDPNHPEAIELKRRALEAKEGRNSVGLEPDVLLTERRTDLADRGAENRGRRPAARWLWLAAATVFTVLSVGTLMRFTLPSPEERAMAEAAALYDAGQRAAAFAQLEAFAPRHPMVTEGLAELRARWTQQAEELAAQARARADGGDVTGAVAMLSGFAPPNDSVTAVLEELRALDPEGTQPAIARARDLFEDGERQQAFDLLQNISPTTPDVQEALAVLTETWEEQAEALALRARTRADDGDLDGAISELEGFAPSYEAVRATLAELRGRLGTLEAARSTVDRAARLFEEGERLEAFRILDDFSPSQELVDREAQRLRQELDQLADVEVNEARQLAADGRLREAVDRVAAFAPPNSLVLETLNELRSELDVQNAAQIAVNDARQLAANGNWSQAFTRLENFTPTSVVADALQDLRAEWDLQGQAVARQAQSRADEGDLAGALRSLAQFQADHPAVTAVETQVTALVNAPRPVAPTTDPPVTDPAVNVEARLVALSDQADDIVDRFIELYEDLDADGMISIWPTASTEDLTPLAETFKNFRSANVQYQEGAPEMRSDTRAVIYCSVAIEYQPVAGARLQVPAVGWQFELGWVDERWQMVSWSR